MFDFDKSKCILLPGINSVYGYFKQCTVSSNVHETFIVKINSKNIETTRTEPEPKPNICHYIRIWKKDPNFTLTSHNNSMNDNNWIGALDYCVYKDHLQIEFLESKDKQIISSLINYVENNAKEQYINKIKVDVHSNLIRFNDKYKSHNFILSGLTCTDNPYWVESEKILKDDTFFKPNHTEG